MSVSSCFARSVPWPQSCPALSPSVGWPLPWKLLSHRLSWRRLRSPWSRSPPRGLPLASRTPLPKAPPSRPRGSILLNQRGPPRAFPSRALPWLRLTVRFPLAATPAPRLLLPAQSSHGVRLAWPEVPHRPSRALQLQIPPRPMLRRQVRGVVSPGAAEARQRRRDKHRRQVRRHTKRSMWREIKGQATARRSMWACCTDTSSQHGHRRVRPRRRGAASLVHLSALGELARALTCRFAQWFYLFAFFASFFVLVLLYVVFDDLFYVFFFYMWSFRQVLVPQQF